MEKLAQGHGVNKGQKRNLSSDISQLGAQDLNHPAVILSCANKWSRALVKICPPKPNGNDVFHKLCFMMCWNWLV